MKKSRFLNIWDKTELYSAGILALLGLGASFYQVVMRYAFNRSPEWAEESVIYFIIGSVFIISSKLVREDGHIGADFVFSRFSDRIKRAAGIFNASLALAFCLMVLYLGVQICLVSFEIDERSTTRLRFPMWIAYSAVPLGSALTSCSFIYRLYLLFFNYSPDMFRGHISKKTSTIPAGEK